MRNRYENEDADDGDMVIPDKGVVRVGMLMMDSVQRGIAFDARNHQPHYATPLNDAAQHNKAAARMQYVARLRDAWKSPARRSMDSVSTTPRNIPIGNITPTDANQLRSMAYDAMVKRLGSAWKTTPLRDQAPPDDDNEPDPHEADVVERQRRDVTAEDLERQRRKIHAEFAQQLSNAWKTR
jgi:hypothetical protein